MNESLRVVIADDERPARSFLAAMLRGFEDVTLVGEAENGAEAVEVIERTKPDLALLDLQMPEVDGLGVARLLKKNFMPLIAFVTAYDEYAVRAFELNAVDYLLKPVERSRLRETVNRAQERLDRSESLEEAAARLAAAAEDYQAAARTAGPRTHSGAPSGRDRHPPGQRGRLDRRRRGITSSDDSSERDLHDILST